MACSRYTRFRTVPTGGNRESRVRRGAGSSPTDPSACQNRRGARNRKAASSASSKARFRARSLRSPSAFACKRQAIRRNRCAWFEERDSSPNSSSNRARNAFVFSLRTLSISLARVSSMPVSSSVRAFLSHLHGRSLFQRNASEVRMIGGPRFLANQLPVTRFQRLRFQFPQTFDRHRQGSVHQCSSPSESALSPVHERSPERKKQAVASTPEGHRRCP